MATRPRLQRARKPQPEVEQILAEAEPEPTGDIEITLEDDDVGEADVSIAAPPVQREREPEPRPAPRQDDDAVARALEAQRRAEQLQADAMRQRDEAIRQAQAREADLARERTEREDAEFNSVLTAIAAEQSSLDKATADYAAAAAAGDWNAAALAQRAMAVAGGRLDRLEDGRRTFDAKREAAAKAPPQQQQQPQQRQPPTFEQQIAALPAPAQAWLRNHPEFITDAAKNREIQQTHGYLVDRRKIQAFSDAYFEALDSEFGFTHQQPERREPEPAPQPQKRSMPMAAPVSREVPTGSGTRKQSSMRLTEEERKIARDSIPDRPDLPKLTNAQKEYMYAKNKAKYEEMKRNGTY